MPRAISIWVRFFHHLMKYHSICNDRSLLRALGYALASSTLWLDIVAAVQISWPCFSYSSCTRSMRSCCQPYRLLIWARRHWPQLDVSLYLAWPASPENQIDKHSVRSLFFDFSFVVAKPLLRHLDLFKRSYGGPRSFYPSRSYPSWSPVMFRWTQSKNITVKVINTWLICCVFPLI